MDDSPAGLKSADPQERDDICHVEVTFVKVETNWDGKPCKGSQSNLFFQSSFSTDILRDIGMVGRSGKAWVWHLGTTTSPYVFLFYTVGM